ncbi:MAG: DEAD/DEAH box helicase [Solibacillus sp.]|uniref:DEAD/DEAH box helicase n=1 Tax=unclassified Solibacillus TaxID=2637870 RepID=UPI0030FC4D37
MEQLIQKLENSLHKGFIDQHKAVSSHFKPKLLSNKAHENVLTTLLQELKTCKTFTFSVAFITEGGLATLKTMLYDLQKKGISGRILTSTFLNFNQPKMFKELLKITNVEVRITDIKGFHSKGYIFEHEDYYSLIVGSSNLTDSALKANFEWNVYLNSLENGEVIQHFKNQFDQAWDTATLLNPDWIRQYKIQYEASIQQPSKVAAPPLYMTNPLKESLLIQPNKMQSTALEQIALLRQSGAKKGLIVSATGTGKTYLSAFDVRNAAPKRMLFIVHREQILKKAMADYRKILLGNEKDYGILSGTSKNMEARYLFATIQTISSDKYLTYFNKDHFDYVLIDEVHRAGAESYLKIINYFEPHFLLGMTATPERTDNFNIYELFDYNIAYEIRLQEALAEDMLCPFHYFGVTDYVLDGELINETSDLQKLIVKERIDHIIDKISYYGFSGKLVKGLMFCSSKTEARELSNILNTRGFKTCALTGEDPQDLRESAIEKLRTGELDYILTVDIFNEGIDIPFLNQIVMLRQTQSSIIFIQQLGRGLRKHDDKEYVTIIDFIGNYKNNYLIPIALSGDKTMNKDNVRRNTVNTNYIQGVSTINFEEVAKKQIFEAIKNTKLSTFKTLKESYFEVKNRIGRIPFLKDFIQQHSLDPEVIISYKDTPTYYHFLIKVGEDIAPLTDYEKAILSLIGKDFLSGKRIHELLLLELILKNDSIFEQDFVNQLRELNAYVDDETLRGIENVFSLNFFVEVDRKKFGGKPLIIKSNNSYTFNDELQISLRDENFKQYFVDLLECAFIKNKKYNNADPFKLYEKYSRREVCRILNWDKNEEGTLNGGRPKNGDFPIFVNYHKDVDGTSETKYMDEFLSSDTFKWCSTKNRYMHSKEMQILINSVEEGTNVLLFVKKDNGEGKDFYYLGSSAVNPTSAKPDKLLDKGKYYPVVTMEMVLEQPIQSDIYHYLVEE